MLRTVLLPHPLGPTIEMNSPSCPMKSKLSTALTVSPRELNRLLILWITIGSATAAGRAPASTFTSMGETLVLPRDRSGRLEESIRVQLFERRNIRLAAAGDVHLHGRLHTGARKLTVRRRHLLLMCSSELYGLGLKRREEFRDHSGDLLLGGLCNPLVRAQERRGNLFYDFGLLLDHVGAGREHLAEQFLDGRVLTFC